MSDLRHKSDHDFDPLEPPEGEPGSTISTGQWMSPEELEAERKHPGHALGVCRWCNLTVPNACQCEDAEWNQPVPMPHVLHRFEVEEKNVRSPIMRRFRFDCECQVKGPWHRDRDSAREDGFAHQDAEL